jgi:hypothetical protein
MAVELPGVLTLDEEQVSGAAGAAQKATLPMRI